MVQQSLPEPSIIDILLVDHRDTMSLLHHFVSESKKTGNEQMIENITDAAALTIRLHSQAEFDVFYPWLEKKGDKKTVQHFTEAHQEIETNLVEALENRKGGDKLTETMMNVLKEFEEHMNEEEEGLVDIFEHASAQELKDLAERFMQAKMSAPLMPQA